VVDELSERFENLLDGTYDCVDRIVLNGYNTMCHSPGGFRTWWRRLYGSDETLDNTHLMRMAGRFSRRVRAFGKANDIPVIDCRRGERKHEIAEEYLATHEVGTGVFMILISRAPAPVWDISHCDDGRIRDIKKKTSYINHYSFHIMDPEWGHITIKIPGHPPFGAQIILNGHEYVAAQAKKRGITFTKESNCFTDTTSARDLAGIADSLSQSEAIGRLVEVCERWIYSSCLCFGLDADERERSGFHYSFSVYQVEYSRNMLFRVGGQMDATFDALAHRAHKQLNVDRLKTLFGSRTRPRATKTKKTPRLAAAIETPTYDMSIFKVHFGNLTLKAYTKGERVLRFEAICHNAKDLKCGRVIDKFPDIVTKLQELLERFMKAIDCVDSAFIADELLDELPLPAYAGKTRVGGIDVNKPRLRAALRAVLALAPSPDGFNIAAFTARVQSMTGQTPGEYSIRQGAYDLKKLRAKNLVIKVGKTHRYEVPLTAARSIAALLTLREHVIKPLLAGVQSSNHANKPNDLHSVDRCYEQIRVDMQDLFSELGIAA
jgi:hypothetical protein